ncbi:MAG: site-specific DNA-methyltransferase [Desulforhopalus sp.]|nr:site-specific DNA-methyltransferase [Desulforhopalus sp.]
MKQDELFNSEHRTQNTEPQPVTCLGIEFPSDEARRQHFTELLRDRLRNPEFRKIEGFPIGSDEDILNLSDPPYYTACPNPWIAEFIAEWEAQKPEQPEGYHYHREPFAADVSEGKNDPIYNAHSYHTKVPHKAIMRYILHYTQPGDIVFDGFCGTGMTGVAAQMCGDCEVVMSLGYQVKPDGTILQEETNEDGKKVWRPFSKMGVRRAVINELSPAATSIANGYNVLSGCDPELFKKTVEKLLKDASQDIGYLYETRLPSGAKAKIDYVIWSDVFVCNNCAGEIVFWDEAVDYDAAKIKSEFDCPNCGAHLSKAKLDHAITTRFDSKLNITRSGNKQVPVLIAASNGRQKFTKRPDSDDISFLDSMAGMVNDYWFPTNRMMNADDDIQKWGDKWRAGTSNFRFVHELYTDRNSIVLGYIWKWINQIKKPELLAALRFAFTATCMRHSLMNTFRFNVSFPSNVTLGTLYIASLAKETNFLDQFKNKCLRRILPFLSHKENQRPVVSSQSSTDLKQIETASVDYLFIDPPFGDNLAYSELNFSWEAWFGVFTKQANEAVVSKHQAKDLSEYRSLMTGCFAEANRILKPGRWVTVEFSNTKASVWNTIQTALVEAGFIVANVSALDKKQGSFNAVTNTTSVKQDLVISAYKPNGGFEERFQKEAQTEEGVWDFVRTHLKYLPVTKQQGALLLFIPERDPRILFDQMIAFYVRKGYPVPISSQEFQVGLSQRFIERDGMFFLPDQVAEYDRKKMTSGELKQMSMFVSDEASAIQWLRQLIKEKPQTFSDINPQFMQQLGGWSKNEAQLDLRELLNQNFLCYDGKGPVPEQIHAYLSTNWKELRNLPKDDPALVTKARDRWYVPDPNKAGDLEKLREKALLKEFEEYKEVKKKLKVFRLEAVRAGFKKAWQERDYAVIVAVADKIPNNVLEEDPKLLMWYDQAVTRMGGE